MICYHTVMKQIALLVAVALLSVSCSDSGTLKKAMMGDDTVETTFNTIAGANGSVSYYRPSGSPSNKNFKLLGVKVKNKTGAADYILQIDLSKMTATRQKVTFGNQIVSFNQLGLPDNLANFLTISTWEVTSTLGL
ncbi:hypothetical protein FACS1894164_09790 [Spirochaetia bacterium]|nr:hypothetical protein FACS1894164_09790 [Spirochaetia bacterium]